MTSRLVEPAEILLVEDNPDDVDLTTEALRESGTKQRLHVVENGPDALKFLRREGIYSDAPSPDLVLLDLNLPMQSGHEVLASIRADPSLRSILVVVLTSSSAESDVRRALALGANAYVTKPVDLDDYVRVVRTIESMCSEAASRRPSN
jgi:CheY-like chemotaxis protein